VDLRLNFLVKNSIDEPIVDMVVPNLLDSQTIVVDDNVANIHGCSTPKSTLSHEPISLDQPAHTYVPYHHPLHRRNDNHAF
jgi:hypothetical protein